jgi:hypothetical protein
MLFRSEAWPAEVHVAAAALDDGPDRAPQVHAFWDTHVDWISVGDVLPRRTEAEVRTGKG